MQYDSAVFEDLVYPPLGVEGEGGGWGGGSSEASSILFIFRSLKRPLPLPKRPSLPSASCRRLNVIFSKFDEVQRSGNMIPSSGSGECDSMTRHQGSALRAVVWTLLNCLHHERTECGWLAGLSGSES